MVAFLLLDRSYSKPGYQMQVRRSRELRNTGVPQSIVTFYLGTSSIKRET